MKLKGVNPIEQHIEKIVLGIVLVLFLAVLSMQFVTRPNDIDVGNRLVSPDQVYTVLEGQARQLESQLSDLSPALPEITTVDLVARYNNAFEQAAGGAVRLSAALGQGVDITVGTGPIVVEGHGADGPVSALAVPMTSRPIAVSQWATLDPYAVVQVPAYEAYIPSAQPYDFASVTIEATFSGKALEAVLTGADDEATAIPRRYWSATGLAILGFEAQRQRLLDNGTWSDAESIVKPPYTPTPTNAMGEEAGLLELSQVISNAASAIEDVARPLFPPTIAGPVWTPPSERIEVEGDSEANRISRLKKQLDRANDELAKLTGSTPSSRPTGRPGRGKQAPSTTPRTTRSNTAQIDRVKKKIEDLKEELKDLGVDVDDQAPGRTRSSAAEVPSILEEESIDLWAHDLGVEHGATYRYRTRVVVNNPLFRKSSELDPDDADQQALALDPFARGPWSSWSDDVVVGAQEYYFVTNAEDDMALGGSKATVEMYKVFYGHYRRSTLSASPGDALASTVRMSGDLLHFDTSVIDAQEAAKVVEALEEEGTDDLPDGISELSNRMSIKLGTYLLDIYSGQDPVESGFGQMVTPMQIVLRESSGAVVVRSDLHDESSQAYQIASKSASLASSTGLRAPGVSAILPSAELFEPQDP